MKTTLRSTLSLVILLGSGCGGSAPDSGPPARVVQDEFVRVFTSGDYAQLDKQLGQLGDAYRTDPSDARTILLLGLANLWGVAEGARAELSLSRQGDLALDGLHYLRLAQTALPDDARIDGWIGTVSTRIANATGDERLRQDGLATVDHAIERYPAFNGFPGMIVRAEADPDSAEFAKALAAGWTVMDACAGRTVDRKNPDFGPYLDRWTSEGELRVCYNPAKAVHNFEGFNLQFGDMMVKAGQIDVARTLYRNAQKSRDYATWPFREQLEQRLESDLDAMSKAFRDPSPAKRPTLPAAGPSSCTFCHQG